MIDYRQNEITIVKGLQSELSTDLLPCTVVFSNKTAPATNYPYVSSEPNKKERWKKTGKPVAKKTKERRDKAKSKKSVNNHKKK